MTQMFPHMSCEETKLFNQNKPNYCLVLFQNPDKVFRQMLSSCSRLGIKRIILVVPGKKGFAYDKTHRTFIDKRYLQQNKLQNIVGYTITLMKHYPFNAAWAGKDFTHNELLVVYDKNERSPHES